MNSGITQIIMVPLKSGTPCFLATVIGLVQSFVPRASPMKLATPSGALSGKSVHVILPAVVSIIAVGGPELAAAGIFFTAGLAAGVGAVWDIKGSEETKRMIRCLRMLA